MSRKDLRKDMSSSTRMKTDKNREGSAYRKVVAVLLIGGILTTLAFYGGYVIGQSIAPTFTTIIEPGSMVGDAAYLVFEDGTNIFARNGQTGAIDYSGSVAATVIQNALNGLTAGRTWKEKVLLKGDFSIGTQLEIPSYTTIEIQGRLQATNGLNEILIQNDNPSTDPSGNRDIEIFGGIIDGNKDNQASPTDEKVTLYMRGVTNVHIHDLTIINGWTAAIRTAFVEYAIIENNRVHNSADDAIAINEETFNATVAGNIVTDAGVGVSYGAPNGIEVQDGAHHVTITANSIGNAEQSGIQVSVHAGKDAVYDVVISSNVINNTIGTRGIELAGLSGTELYNITVIGNLVNNVTDTTGASVFLNYVINSSLIGNTVIGGRRGIDVANSYNIYIQGNTVADAYLFGILIEPSTTYSHIAENVAYNNGRGLSGSRDGIGIQGDNNYIVNNKAFDTRTGGSRTQQYGIVVYAGADDNVVQWNILYNNALSELSDSGTGTIIKYNVGYVTENSGTAVILNGGNTVVVAHGLAATPTIVIATGRNSDTNDLYVSARDGTNITLVVTGTVGADRTVDWYAEV